MELLIGIALALFGIAALLASYSPLAPFVYPIIWWGIILLLDAVNYKRWGASLIHGSHRHALLVLVPISAIFWLYYEFANLVFPQWLYEGIIGGVGTRTALSVVSFGTVIPIVGGILWFLRGPVLTLPFSASQASVIQKYALAFAVFGALSSLMPFFSSYFWLNQLMWIGPFLFLLPFVVSESQGGSGADQKKFWYALVATGIVSGILWELLNFWAGGKWKYIIFPDAIRLFEMPILGYLGFIPFAFSTVAVYLFAKKYIAPSVRNGTLLYAFAVAASYYFVISL